MSAVLERTLPGTPGPSLEAVCAALSPEAREAFEAHLLGGTSADWLATTMRDAGHKLSASTIRTYRRSLRQTGV